MSSFIRRIQKGRGATGRPFCGTKLGVHDPLAKDLLARRKRELKREAKRVQS